MVKLQKLTDGFQGIFFGGVFEHLLDSIYIYILHRYTVMYICVFSLEPLVDLAVGAANCTNQERELVLMFASQETSLLPLF